MAFSPLFAANVALAWMLHARSPVLSLAAIATFALSVHLWGGRLTDHIAGARAGREWERHRARITRWRGPHPDRRPISGIDSLAWVHLEREPGESRPGPGYRLCIATHYAGGGGEVTLAFSDGTAESCDPASPQRYHRYAGPPPQPGDTGGRREAAAALGSLVHDLARNGATPLDSMIKNRADEYAVRAAVLWGLVAAADDRDTARLHALIGSSGAGREPGPAVAVTVTHAGRVWLDCDPHRPGPDRTAPGADGTVLAALAEVLRIPEVWERPGLRQAHHTIATAVADGHPDTPAVRSAVDQVLALAGGLVLGVAGTTGYDTLKGFVP